MLAVDSLPGSIPYAKGPQIFKKEQQVATSDGLESDNQGKEKAAKRRSNGPTQATRRSLASPQVETRCQTPSRPRRKSDKTKQFCNVKLPKITTNVTTGTRQSTSKTNVSLPLNRRKSTTDIRLSLHTFSSQLKSKQLTSKGRNGTTSRNSENPKATKRKGKSPYIIYAIMPSNLLEEKRNFFASGYKCNPVFVYDTPADESTLARYNHASYTLLPQAVRIMDIALQKYGCYEKFEETTAGRRLAPHEFQERFDSYLKAEKLENQVFLNMTPDLLSRALMTRSKGRSVMNIKLSILRDNWAQGVLQHEIGTHFTRAQNNRQQPWRGSKGKRKFGLQPLNPTEEGLASLHSVLGRKDPCLWRAALLYFTVYNASRLSFADLFERLGRFLQDPEVRWDYCMRAKRGQVDTSKPGCFNKDQVYLDGVLQILRYRNEIDFHSLVRLGKVSYLDVDRLKKDAVLDPSTVILPSFMLDLDHYRNKLTEILLKNGLSDLDLKGIFPKEMHQL
ncbi:hypothetical protein BSL78_08831 [Apostichopus japonicus]|uniref:Uncharacterized protein n=1 Tax=Stichopus japonicus TaxID=307972 RepID=A0A2G8L1X0_STIJA|nr:hypothetical protein BSL78_08831 [Apostichopus japonicus]